MKILLNLPLYIIVSLDCAFLSEFTLHSSAIVLCELSGAENSTHVVSIEGNRIIRDGGPIFLSVVYWRRNSWGMSFIRAGDFD